MLPRALTTGEKIAIRANGQFTELFLVIPKPASVYTARVNGAPGSTDQLTQITYDGGSGTLADVLPGMTLFVGSTAGAYDRGQARIRKTPTSSIFYIGTESEIDVQDNDYLTIMDEFGLWQRPVRAVSATEAYMDYDVAYSAQHTSRLPVVVMGGPAVVTLVGGAAVATFDASESWEPGGGTPSFSWAASTADSIDDDTSATPAITFSSTGRHRVSCTVTIDGTANTRYEYVYVLGDDFAPVTQFRLNNLSGSKVEGGYTFGLTLYAEAALADVRDRAQVLLCERTYGGGQVTALGYATGRENILAVGWIAGETLEWSPDVSSVTFQCDGAHAWLNRITAYPQGLEDTGGTTAASAWTNYNNLTVTAMMWHLLTWRSTVAQAIDCHVEANSLRAVELSAAASTLWEQIQTIAGIRLLAAPCSDRLSRLFIQIDAQFRSEDARTGVADVLTLTAADWRPPLRLTRAPVSDTCQVDLSGVGYDGANATAYFALAPGRTFRRFGRVRAQQSLLIASQAHANALAGLVAGQANNLYPVVPLQLAGRLDRFIDLAPDCYLMLAMDAASTPRATAFNGRLLPRRIDYSWDAAVGVLLAALETEAETGAMLAVTGDAPPSEPVPPPSTPPGNPTPPDLPKTAYLLTRTKVARTRNMQSAAPNYTDITGALTGDLHEIILDPWHPATVAWAVTEDGIYRTANLDDAAPTWTLKKSASAMMSEWGGGGTFTGFHRIKGNITAEGLFFVMVGVLGTNAIVIGHTHDNGATWTWVTAISGSVFLGIQTLEVGQHNGNIVVTGCQPAGGHALALISTDGGHTFNNYYNPGSGDQTVADALLPLNDNPSDAVGYLLLDQYLGESGNPSVVRTTDGGAHWTDITPSGFGQNPSTVYGQAHRLGDYTADRQRLYASDGYQFFYSQDAGDNFTRRSSFSISASFGGFPYNNGILYRLAAETLTTPSSGAIFASVDGGYTWLDKTGDWGSVIGDWDSQGDTAGGPDIIPLWVEL